MIGKNRICKYAAAALSTILALGSFSPVYAAERTSDSYLPDETGTITLYKYVNNDGASTTTNGQALAGNPDEQLDAIEQATGNYNMIPEEGVDFMYVKVGDFEQVDVAGGSQTTPGEEGRTKTGRLPLGQAMTEMNLPVPIYGQYRLTWNGTAVSGTVDVYAELDGSNSTLMATGSILSGRVVVSGGSTIDLQLAGKFVNLPGIGARTDLGTINVNNSRGSMIRVFGVDGEGGGVITWRGSQTTETASMSGVYFTNLDEGFLNVLTELNAAPIPSSDMADADRNKPATQKHYTTEEIYRCIHNANIRMGGEDALREYTSSMGTALPSTDYYGRTKSGELPLGLYLVSEVNWEHQTLAKHDTYWIRVEDEGTEDAGDGSEKADIVSPSSPFLLQLPMAIEDKWLYDVTAYPKNGTLNIHKDIIVETYADINEKLDTEENETLCDYRQLNYTKSEGGEYIEGVSDESMFDGSHNIHATHQRDANIGDVVTQLISSDVPALVGEKTNTAYRITDHMTKGLVFSEIKSVVLSQNAFGEGGEELEVGTDYSFAVEEASFTVELTQHGLAKLDEVPSASYLYILFDSTVTKDALIGTDTYEYTTNDNKTVDATNQNTAMLTYATDRTAEHDYYSNTCRIYTYEIDLQKTLARKIAGAEDKSVLNGEIDYSAVKFTVKGTGDGGTSMKDIVFTKEAPGVFHVYDPINDLDGYDPENDTLEDPQTITKYVSLAEDGTLVLKGVDSRDYIFTEVSTVENYQLLNEPVKVRLVAPTQTPESPRKLETGALGHVYVWTGEEPEDIRPYDLARTEAAEQLAAGRAPVGIQNNSTFHMLRTGGTGTILFIAGGAALLIGAGAWLYLQKKKESDEEDADSAERG